MKFNLRKAQQHIQFLVEKHKIKLVHTHSLRWRVRREDRYVRIRSVKSIVTYIDTLFAFGYIFGKWRSKPRLFRIAGAWKWAKENALFWTPRMNQIMEKSLLTSWEWQIYHETAVLPSENHEFWKLLSKETTETFKRYLQIKEIMET